MEEEIEWLEHCKQRGKVRVSEWDYMRAPMDNEEGTPGLLKRAVSNDPLAPPFLCPGYDWYWYQSHAGLCWVVEWIELDEGVHRDNPNFAF